VRCFVFSYACPPLQFSREEPINGGTLDDFKKYGVVSLVERKREREGCNPDVEVQVSMPLLRIINSDKYVPDHLLMVNRPDNKFTTLEEVQAYSLMCSINAQLLTKVNAQPITPATLRPGATLVQAVFRAEAAANGADTTELDSQLAVFDAEVCARSEPPILYRVVRATKRSTRASNLPETDRVVLLSASGEFASDSVVVYPGKGHAANQSKSITFGSEDRGLLVRSKKDGLTGIIEKVHKAHPTALYAEVVTTRTFKVDLLSTLEKEARALVQKTLGNAEPPVKKGRPKKAGVAKDPAQIERERLNKAKPDEAVLNDRAVLGKLPSMVVHRQNMVRSVGRVFAGLFANIRVRELMKKGKELADGHNNDTID
jgi:hypothetical protein